MAVPQFLSLAYMRDLVCDPNSTAQLMTILLCTKNLEHLQKILSNPCSEIIKNTFISLLLRKLTALIIILVKRKFQVNLSVPEIWK